MCYCGPHYIDLVVIIYWDGVRCIRKVEILSDMSELLDALHAFVCCINFCLSRATGCDGLAFT